MQLYSKEDSLQARAVLRRRAWVFGGALALLLAGYVALTIIGSRNGMLAVLLAALVYGVFVGDMYLLPALRYHRFLKSLETGLRRELACAFERVESEPQMQDGAKVCAVHLKLEDGDSRILYWNASKLDKLPSANVQIEITSCGRHAVGWKVL